MPDRAAICAAIVRRLNERGLSLTAASAAIGRNAAYLQQFIARGSPRRLPEDERLRLAMLLDLDERELGARDPWTPVKTVPLTATGEPRPTPVSWLDLGGFPPISGSGTPSG